MALTDELADQIDARGSPLCGPTQRRRNYRSLGVTRGE
jgi:hypothetical protein